MPLPEALASRAPQAFPTLSTDQIERICAHGRLRPVTAGEVLVEPGDESVSLFVVKRGKLQVFRVFGDSETFIVEHGPGQFSGEIILLSGRPALGRIRAAEPGEVLEVDRENLLALVQTDPELGEILMRAFILRRMGLIASQTGDVVLGSDHNADTLRVKEFLTRNGHPYRYKDLDQEADMQELLDRFHVGLDDIPVLICRGEVVLRKPTNAQIADCLGFNSAIDPAQVRDLVVVGAGPAGLAAAVYAASEGLDVLVLETTAPGGQAGSSSRIENYLGFPNGISGLELASRAYNQAIKFGAQFTIARGAARLTCDRKPFTVDLGNGETIRARIVLIATGAEYRKLPLENLSRFEGVGVYYAATFMESQLCRDEEVIVVGGGNSAGQAAVFLSGASRHVHLLVRSDSLASSMSRYLIRRIEESDRITL
ncbi:MAG TPA: FAD-dependent oxidoreductase, partial [Chthonomonadaceae bacterium]|nr:FAD-dependent oxidoreductase [Chthonomonadaceae bacterium]